MSSPLIPRHSDFIPHHHATAPSVREWDAMLRAYSSCEHDAFEPPAIVSLSSRRSRGSVSAFVRAVYNLEQRD